MGFVGKVSSSSCVMVPVAARGFLLFILGLSLAGAGAAGEEQFAIRLELGRLDGKKEETGSVVIEVHPDWAPRAAARVREIVAEKVWETARFFRVVDNFVVQWGIPGKPSSAAKWREDKIQDDPVLPDVSNLEGYVTFAKSGPDTRTTQVFINLKDNTNLDGMEFPPFGRVVEGMDVVRRINSAHGEKPDQGQIQSSGNVYLKKEFPDLTFIKSVTILQDKSKIAGGEL